MVDDNPSGTVDTSGPMDLSAGIAAYARSLDDDGAKKPAEDIAPPPETFDADDEDDEDTDAQAAEDFDEPVDDEDEDEGQSEDEDEAPEPDPPAAQYADDKAKVRLEDGTEVTVAELRKGTLLQADYTTKTMALAKDRETVAQEREQTQQYAGKVHEDRMYLARVAQAILPQPPPQTMLNPASPDYNQTLYHQWKAQYEQKMHELGTIDAQIAAYDQQIASETEKHFLETRQSEGQKLLERVPEFKDPTFQKRFWRDAIKAGEEVYGYTQAEVEALNDHRDFMVLKDALSWQRLKAKQRRAAKKSDGKPQIVMHGGTRRSPQEIAESNRRAAMKRLEKTGSMQDGIRAYLASQRD